MRPVVIFINGPPRAGKDMLGEYLLKKNPGFEVVKLAKILKERTHALYGGADLKHDHFEDVKDQPNEFFLGWSPRQAYINVSERYMKPVHGDQIYGELFIKEIKERFSAPRGYLITDSGFVSETLPIFKHFGADHCILVRIHGRGAFAGDSRSFLDLPIYTIDVTNDGDKHTFQKKVEYALNPILHAMIADTGI
jgi:hypothetical protein